MPSNQADFLVVGGGIAGASVAYELSATSTVILLEAEDAAGYHSTGRSAAVMSEIYGSALWSRPVTGSRGFLEDPPPGLSDVPLVLTRGALFLARPEERDDLQRQGEELIRRAPSESLAENVPDDIRMPPVGFGACPRSMVESEPCDAQADERQSSTSLISFNISSRYGDCRSRSASENGTPSIGSPTAGSICDFLQLKCDNADRGYASMFALCKSDRRFNEIARIEITPLRKAEFVALAGVRHRERKPPQRGPIDQLAEKASVSQFHGLEHGKPSASCLI
jgi:hypothetical protein